MVLSNTLKDANASAHHEFIRKAENSNDKVPVVKLPDEA
jgi:hypothetical protein